MLIQSSFSMVQGSVLHVPLWNRAPLNLSAGTRVFAAALLDDSPVLPEIVVTTFPPDIWGDLWRIELDVYQSPGLLAQVLGLLRDQRVHILAAESTALDAGHVHAISLLADCRDYASNGDLTTDARSQMQRPELRDLHAYLAATFIKDFVFANGETPRLRVRRLYSYYRCRERLRSGELGSTVDLVINNGELFLPDAIMEPVRDSLGAPADPIRAMILTDSKDRIMRVLFSLPNTGVIHIRVFFRYAVHVPALILSIIDQASFDIIRSQLRQGLFRPPSNLRPAISTEYATLDLLLKNLYAESTASDQDLLAVIRSRLTTTQELNGYDATVELAKFIPPKREA